LGQNLLPDAAVLLDPTDQDIEEDNLQVRWQRNRDFDFFCYELWMDTQPEVTRIREGLIFTSTPFSWLSTDGSFFSTDSSLRSASERIGTSKLVFRSFGANSNFDTMAFATFVEEFGQMISSFVVGSLEPETQYFFRLYIVDLNYETVASNVVAITTKAKRCRFLRTGNSFISRSAGPTGTVVNVNFDSGWAAFTSNHRMKIGEKFVTATSINDYQVQITFPDFLKKDIYRDLVVYSPNGLFDCRRNAIMVSSS
jgi:hypothetical protein